MEKVGPAAMKYRQRLKKDLILKAFTFIMLTKRLLTQKVTSSTLDLATRYFWSTLVHVGLPIKNHQVPLQTIIPDQTKKQRCIHASILGYYIRPWVGRSLSLSQ